MQAGYLSSTTAITSTFNITGTQANTVQINNTGVLETPPYFSFTPSSNFTSLQIQLAEGYGFTLSGAFISGQLINFDCSTGYITINGNQQYNLQSAGSVFFIPPGNVILYVYATNGTLVVSATPRII
jgi:hypothetical protein